MREKLAHCHNAEPLRLSNGIPERVAGRGSRPAKPPGGLGLEAGSGGALPENAEGEGATWFRLSKLPANSDKSPADLELTMRS
jgi:hypothetical protein